MLMIMNNLDERVAQYPQELVTYGGNGQVFSNWAQVAPPPSYFTLPHSGVSSYGALRDFGHAPLLDSAVLFITCIREQGMF